MANKNCLIITGLLFFLSGRQIAYGQEKLNNSIAFIQGDSSFSIINKTDSITLDRAPFSIRYFCNMYMTNKKLYYSAQVAFLDNPEDTLNLSIGQKIKNIPYLKPGTGMAPGQNGMYDTIFIGNTGHHYLIYENENNKRANLISKKNNLLELEWKISAAFYDEKDVQFSGLKLTYIFFVVLINKNINEIVDSDEIKIVKIKFR